MTALLVGTVLALGALAFVLIPLFRASPSGPRASAPGGGGAEPSDASPSESAIVALREVEFDRATGKLSDADYEALKAKYTGEALTALRAEDASAPNVSDAALEEMILAYRGDPRRCPDCGIRPEADALYCSTCGRYLPGACARCGAGVTEAEAKYCNRCGATLRDSVDSGVRIQGTGGFASPALNPAES